jgi:hypothetical protein
MVVARRGAVARVTVRLVAETGTIATPTERRMAMVVMRMEVVVVVVGLVLEVQLVNSRCSHPHRSTVAPVATTVATAMAIAVGVTTLAITAAVTSATRTTALALAQ